MHMLSCKLLFTPVFCSTKFKLKAQNKHFQIISLLEYFLLPNRILARTAASCCLPQAVLVDVTNGQLTLAPPPTPPHLQPNRNWKCDIVSCLSSLASVVIDGQG